MSARESTLREDLICSGDMYSGEPMIADVLVSDMSALLSPVGSVFEIPKSRTLSVVPPSRRRDRKQVRRL